jgi:glycosyltransferase involved in cell wall biosynthesis
MLLLPARLVSVKAPARALELLFHLRAHVDACLIVAGEGPLRSALERRATSMKVARHVQFIGQRGDMASLYGAADVVVLTSVNEGTPLCLLEAMAAGTPVAATRVGGVADILGDDGLLFEPAAEPAAWARALVDHLDRKDDLRATVERARERVRSHHHPASMVASVRLLYEELLRRRS